jgi:hypothetical protein
MFVGHYGVSFATKSVGKTIPLWVLFIAVQLLDVFWGIFVPLGIEKVRIVPGFTASNPLDLYYMPYTHSLVAALFWSAAATIAYKAIRKVGASNRAAGLVGLAVFSHWVLDLVVHVPDLPLYDNTFKMGFGLWNYRWPAFLLEAAILFGGIILYSRSTSPKSAFGRWGMPLFGVVMLLVQAGAFFGPPPAAPWVASVEALALYALFAAVAGRLERARG